MTLASLAQPGTDSWYFAAHLDRLPKAADLVLVDYVTNDLGILEGDATEHATRAVTEKIVRAALALPKKPTVILLGLLRTLHLTTAAHHAFQDAVYARVADAYFAAQIFRRRVAAAPRLGRGYSVKTKSRPRRGWDAVWPKQARASGTTSRS